MSVMSLNCSCPCLFHLRISVDSALIVYLPLLFSGPLTVCVPLSGVALHQMKEDILEHDEHLRGIPIKLTLRTLALYSMLMHQHCYKDRKSEIINSVIALDMALSKING